MKEVKKKYKGSIQNRVTIRNKIENRLVNRQNELKTKIKWMTNKI